jgi:hypothetical protein
MTLGEPRYRWQGVDYLGFLETKLRDLRGIDTLVYELIQNADDVKDDEGQPGASLISFDAREDALIVKNDGVFREVDFERMQNVASGGKREEMGTTGTFGIGFIAVYQITDYPELFSSGLHWTIRPEQDDSQRIEERDAEMQGTLFRLPWAFDPDSAVRRKLRIEAVQPAQLSDFELEMGQALSLAALFLKQLKVLELKREGKLVKRIEREVMADGRILIKDGDQTAVWHIFRGSFHSEAERLQRSFRQIEAKKRGDVLVAIPDEGLEMGRLFAVLPSRTTIPLPFHVNADFFPSSDRTRIIFGTDYQSEWNRAAVRAAAQALAGGLDKLPQLLGHEGLWRLLRSLAECDQEVTQGKHDPVFAAFWEEVAPGLSTQPIVFTTTDRWVTPGEARLLESNAEQEAASVLEGLAIQIVHPELRPFRNLLLQKEIGTLRLNVQDVAQGLKRVGLNKRTPLDRAPSRLRTVEAWRKLWRALYALLARLTLNERELANGMLGASVIALGDDGALWPPT